MPEDIGDNNMLLDLVDKLYDLVDIPVQGVTTDDVLRMRLARDLEIDATGRLMKRVADRLRRQ